MPGQKKAERIKTEVLFIQHEDGMVNARMRSRPKALSSVVDPNELHFKPIWKVGRCGTLAASTPRSSITYIAALIAIHHSPLIRHCSPCEAGG